jgi:hypothetical protein
MKNFGSFTAERKSAGWVANAACKAVVPAFGAPMMKKSGNVMPTSRGPVRHEPAACPGPRLLHLLRATLRSFRHIVG